ncbi:ABC transporter permease [Anaerocolumna sp. AGMB13025]|uniref:ABC transporter permease n=1 Tax=Anaerocolumna sp. AGMB13025 TaxID=3039116 RepID=UPI00241F2606|nr:ABC transporter permease [Anaerocolumna sp. AGMB13025]WFR59387.1 ABC transporter permease [Anaerocolumna sp. AGMB13025]
MKNTIRQVFRSPRFVIGFTIFSFILLTVLIYPLIFRGNPLQMVGLGSFFKPGTYVSTYDAVGTEAKTMKLPDAEQKRLLTKLNDEDRVSMVQWLTAAGVSADQIDMQDTQALLKLWEDTYDPSIKPKGMTMAQRNYYKRLNSNLENAINNNQIIIAQNNEETNTLEQSKVIADTDYVNIKDIANVKRLPLGTDNFGRDVLKELVSATGTSILIGLIAGVIATFIGLSLGLLAGYLGGIVDDIIMFITNIFTVIPSFVLLILISYSISQDQRGATTVAIVIGMTSWVWTTRSVRSQVISLRNRDHVNLSKLSGHSLIRIIITDILPYIASYVVMALILQISTAILAEAQLSMLGLGPKTTEIPTLGLMMNWAMLYSAHLNGSWWAYFPVILTIALVSFSLNLMNTGLDQVFNPTLRD